MVLAVASQEIVAIVTVERQMHYFIHLDKMHIVQELACVLDSKTYFLPTFKHFCK